MGGIYALVGLALNFQYALMRIINVSHGEFIMFSTYLVYWLFTLFHLNPILSMSVIVPLLFVIGLILHKLLFERLLHTASTEVIETNSLLMTFGLLIFIQNFVSFVWTPTPRSVTFLNTSVVFACFRIST